ncbi:MAG: FAD-dependent oxidoreductase [Bdellovibrionia bacterium]
MIQLLGAGAASIYLGGCTSISKNTEPQVASDWIDLFGPVDRSLGDHIALNFSGDNPVMAHEILWNKKAFLAKHGALNRPVEEADLVIVGGGMSGLLTAYNLKDLNPLVLDQAPRLGGNSRAESWRGLDYSLATAYFAIPEEGTKIEKFFKDLEIDKILRVREANDPIFIDGVRYDDFWAKGTNEASKPQFQKLKKILEDTAKAENGEKYPNIPFDNDSDRKYVEKLDRMSFKQWAEKRLGPLHPHVEAVIEYYFWSAAAASSTEISAAGGLNFFAADFGPIGVTPGGNAAIAKRILQDLAKTMKADRFRVNSLVFDVRVEKNHTLVSYWDGQAVKTVKAKAVVMSCPKFVAQRAIEGLEKKRLEVYKSLRYRSYMLANLLIDESLEDSFYDLFFFHEGSLDTGKVRDSARRQRITDVVYGNYAKPRQPQTVLTLFRGYPYDEARSEILIPDAYPKYREEFDKQIRQEVLPQLKLHESKIVDLRIARWGHPLPLSEKGTISKGKVEWLRKPFKNRVFFVEQDNWMLPAFETCFYEADHFAPAIRKVVKA